MLGSARPHSASPSSALRLASRAGPRLKTPPAARPARNGTRKDYLTSVDIGLFTGPHQTSFLDDSSSTIRLSDGERPVLAPEYAESAPVDVMAEPDS